jgi:hypothetical protein
MRKTYQIPSVEMAILTPCTIICTSPGAGISGGSGGTGGSEFPGGGGPIGE